MDVRASKPKPIKVKILVFQICYLALLITSFFIMVGTQNGNGIAAFIFFTGIAIPSIATIIKGLVWLIKNWNKDVTL